MSNYDDGHCPICHSGEIDYGEEMFSGGVMEQLNVCRECSAQWEDTWKIIKQRIVEPGKKLFVVSMSQEKDNGNA